MKRATLVFPLTPHGTVILGEKRIGEIGKGTLNGPGGKCEPGESVVECAIRECTEELELTLSPEQLTHVATIDFTTGDEVDFSVEVFLAHNVTGTPQTTPEMIPHEVTLDSIPYDRMLESDREWLPKIFAGEKFYARVAYKERAAGFSGIEFLPYQRMP